MQKVVVLVAKVSVCNVRSTLSGWPSNAKSKEEFSGRYQFVYRTEKDCKQVEM
ncbi:MAG: hypothetical protein DF168_00065 [Candidatus Moanabacter tarae]|uniref:Uncharacterized protein n=1 Tax=Candidatus Moanibacter tarae TaxID=2200854 RepID=A0A2Z4AAS4_9BACT|nr:MAG: hypothetical protein DF168_00065 [Candidatus Moanabacter tarae]